jgi:hypothetical protein
MLGSDTLYCNVSNPALNHCPARYTLCSSADNLRKCNASMLQCPLSAFGIFIALEIDERGQHAQ